MAIDKVMNAESVAIVGASKDKTKRGYQTVKTLLDEKFEGRIFPVNPKEKIILGLKCYPSVSAIEEPVDVVLIATPAKTVPLILEDCGPKGVQGAVILAVGFGESGAEGRRLEEKMLETAKKHGIRLIGPNTSGMMNLNTNLNLVGIRNAPKGEIGLLTQSGNMALTLITEAAVKSQKGFSYYVGVGNETDIKFHEYLEFFQQDPNTKAILMYVEGLREGRKFLQQAYKTSLQKPIILLKSGRSVAGKKSAGSHTGALAGISEVAKSAFERAGITVIENSDELFPVAEALSSLPPMKNNQVAILADGGGHATIAADLLTDLNVKIPELSEKTQARLRKILPTAASVRNPIDVAGGADADPSIFAKCIEIIIKDPDIAGILNVGLFGGYGIRFTESLTLIEEDAAHMIGRLLQKHKKPIIFHSLYASAQSHPIHLLRYYNVPVYDSLDVACRCIGALTEYGDYVKSYHAKSNFMFDWGKKRKKKVVNLFRKAEDEGRNVLLETEAKQLLAAHGVAMGHDLLAKTEDEAVAFAKRIEGDVAMKIVSPNILHKTDAGGVRLNLKTEKQVRQGFRDIMQNAKAYNPSADLRGIIVSPMASKGMEVIIGTKQDDQFGPVIMFGLGGIMVEILKDVSFRVLPISPNSAKKMIEEIKAFPILNGARGRGPYDLKALRQLLLKCSEIVEAYLEIREMDLNPVIVHDKGLSIVDARIIL